MSERPLMLQYDCQSTGRRVFTRYLSQVPNLRPAPKPAPAAPARVAPELLARRAAEKARVEADRAARRERGHRTPLGMTQKQYQAYVRKMHDFTSGQVRERTLADELRVRVETALAVDHRPHEAKSVWDALVGGGFLPPVESMDLELLRQVEAQLIELAFDADRTKSDYRVALDEDARTDEEREAEDARTDFIESIDHQDAAHFQADLDAFDHGDRSRDILTVERAGCGVDYYTDRESSPVMLSAPEVLQSAGALFESFLVSERTALPDAKAVHVDERHDRWVGECLSLLSLVSERRRQLEDEMLEESTPDFDTLDREIERAYVRWAEHHGFHVEFDDAGRPVGHDARVLADSVDELREAWRVAQGDRRRWVGEVGLVATGRKRDPRRDVRGRSFSDPRERQAIAEAIEVIEA